VTAENTEEKAAEVTASSEMAGQTQEAVRPKGKWVGRGIYGSKGVPPLRLRNELTVADLLCGHFASAIRIVHNVESTAYREENDHSHDHQD